MIRLNRYVRILEEIRRLKAVRILEVGTWNGYRAIQMIRAAASPTQEVQYYGFDMFEGMNDKISKKEFNVKKPHSMAEVEKELKKGLSGIRASWLLFKGDTRATLPAAVSKIGPETIDLAWIDGGHSVETVQSDWASCAKLLRKEGVALFDDHYSGMTVEALSKFGCNQLFKSLQQGRESAGRMIKSAALLPDADPVKGGGKVRIARVEVF
jgi:predicted O-methyltransferase YrrM